MSSFILYRWIHRMYEFIYVWIHLFILQKINEFIHLWKHTFYEFIYLNHWIHLIYEFMYYMNSSTQKQKNKKPPQNSNHSLSPELALLIYPAIWALRRKCTRFYGRLGLKSLDEFSTLPSCRWMWGHYLQWIAEPHYQTLLPRLWRVDPQVMSQVRSAYFKKILW